jgi:hypothetical protein
MGELRRQYSDDFVPQGGVGACRVRDVVSKKFPAAFRRNHLRGGVMGTYEQESSPKPLSEAAAPIEVDLLPIRGDVHSLVRRRYAQPIIQLLGIIPFNGPGVILDTEVSVGVLRINWDRNQVAVGDEIRAVRNVGTASICHAMSPGYLSSAPTPDRRGNVSGLFLDH